MLKATVKYAGGMPDVFPDQIQVFDLGSFKDNARVDFPSLLHRHFREPLTKEALEKLVAEIAGYLKDQDEYAVYSFFYRSARHESMEAGWSLSAAKLNKCDKGSPKEIVLFSYDLQLLGDIKKRLYRVLENDEFFRQNFIKVSSLTKREKEIVRLLASGMSSTQIAAVIHISVHTVNTHRKNINNKLAIQNFASLLHIADVFDLSNSEI
jgi:DNA-binding CsgD family transcriptional regulator